MAVFSPSSTDFEKVDEKLLAADGAVEKKLGHSKSIHEVIDEIRDFVESECHVSNPLFVRRDSQNYPLTCRVLSELEYQLVQLHDTNFREVVDWFGSEIERRRSVGETYEAYRQAYKRSYGEEPPSGRHEPRRGV